MEKTSPAHCRRHAGARAGWSCDNCQAPLCPECVVVRRSFSTEYLECGLCQGRALPLLAHRSTVPFTFRLRGLWRYPFTQSGIAVLLGLSFLLCIARLAASSTFLLLKFLPLVLGLGMFWGTFFHIIRSSARGERELDTPEYSDLFKDCITPAIRGAVGTSLLWLPGLIYLFAIKRWDVSRPTRELLNRPSFYVTGGRPELDWSQVAGDPVLWLVMLAGAIWLPGALLLAASGQGVLTMLNPLEAVRTIRRLGRDYSITLGVFAVLAVAFALMKLLAGGLLALELPLVSGWGAELLTCVVPFLMARVLGLLLYARGDTLGYGTTQDYLEPVLGATRPLHEPAALREPLTLTPAPQEETASSPPLSGTLAALIQSVEEKDAGKALALYPELKEPRLLKQLDPAHHLFVGQAATAQGNYELAVKALETAADVAPESPSASRALVLMARVYGERLKDVARAQSIYRYVVHRYPDTEACRYAQARLSPTS